MAATVKAPNTRKTNIPNIGNRKASFTDVEKFFLRALLVDSRVNNKRCNTRPWPKERPNRNNVECMSDHDIKNEMYIPNRPYEKQLDDSVLFQIPFTTNTITDQSKSTRSKPITQFGRHKKKILGLWQAYSDGAHPKIMHVANQQLQKRQQQQQLQQATVDVASKFGPSTSSVSQESGGGIDTDELSVDSVPSDVRVRQPEVHDENSSWGEDDGGFLHYDAWEVLEDE